MRPPARTLTPARVHHLVLAALADAADDVGCAGVTPGRWYVGHAPGPHSLTSVLAESTTGSIRAVAYGVNWRDAHLIVTLHNAAAAAYAGVRHILERHRPRPVSVLCDWCAPDRWACPDYLDATAVIPHLPEEVTRALST